MGGRKIENFSARAAVFFKSVARAKTDTFTEFAARFSENLIDSKICRIFIDFPFKSVYNAIVEDTNTAVRTAKARKTMTELETLQRAKMYLDKMANGIDPLSDQPAPDSDCINQVRISRCLFYVSDILRKLIENGGVIEKASKAKKIPFDITQDELLNYDFDGGPIPITEVTRKINSLVDSESMTKLKYSSITAFLIRCGFLEEVNSDNGRTAKRPTADGNLIGITSEERMGRNGIYHVTVYNAEAQKFILDNIETIIEINN